MPTKCHVHNCTKPAVSKGLCDTHRKRVARHGTTAQTRPTDWGTKEKHPAYKTWCNLRRYYTQDADPCWLADFWVFAAAVPAKPEGRSRAQRPDASAPWGADNFYWREPTWDKQKRDEHRAYMREYARKMRAANPEYGKDKYLRKTYGITLAEYDALSREQGGCCAICGRPETSVIHGRNISLAVDHDHATGAVRGLLCANCNTGLGLLKDNPALLEKAIFYLQKHLA